MIAWLDTALLLALIGSPLLGAFFVSLMPGSDRVTLRYVGMGASLFSAALALRGLYLVVTQGQLALGLSLPGVSFPIDLALHEGSLPAVLCICAAIPMAIRAGAPRVQVWVKGYVLLLLLAESLALSTVLVDQPLAAVVLVDGLVFPVLLLLALFGGERKGSLGLRFGVVWVAADGFALAVLAAAASGTDVSELLAPALFVSGGVRLGVFPFTSWWVSLYEEAPVSVVALLAAVVGPAGADLIRRGVLLTGGDVGARGFTTVVTVSLLTVLATVFLLLTVRDLKRWVGALSTVAPAAALIAFACGHPEAVAAAMWLVPLAGVAVSGLAFIVDGVERRTHTRDSAELLGLAQQLPGLWRVWMVSGAAAVGLPLVGVGAVLPAALIEIARSGAFAAAHWLPHAGFFVAAGLSTGVLFGALSLIVHLRRALAASRSRTRPPAPLTGAQAFRLWIPVAVLLAGGALAHTRLAPAAASMTPTLRPTPPPALLLAAEEGAP